MNYRKLRIAWSVGRGVVAVLLFALWVRSYGECGAYFPFGFRVYPSEGRVVLGDSWKSIHDPDFDHQLTCYPVYVPPNNEFDIPAGWTSVMGYLDTGLKLPLWYLFVGAVSLAAAPWLRFSLRTIFIATAVVAVVVGISTWMSRAG